MKKQIAGPIGVFDSGYGGLTVYRELRKKLPDHDFLYLGDNARVPYGSRSFDTVYKYTLECVDHLFDRGCNLVILACNTASAKALRNIQQLDLPKMKLYKRVLGVIRPTSETIGAMTKTKHIGLFATTGTVRSDSYKMEIEKFFPKVNLYQEACPMWVPLIENNEHLSTGANYFIKKHISNLLARSKKIDAIILACTHYPLLEKKLRRFIPKEIKLISQGEIVSRSLVDYLARHPKMDALITKQGKEQFLTTESTSEFDQKSILFLGEQVKSHLLVL